MEKLFEKVPINGIFNLKIFKSGKLIEETTEKNLVVNGAMLQMSRLLAGDVMGRHIAKIAFGTSGMEASATDASITNQWSKQISAVSYPINGQVQFNWELLVAENNGMAISEFGLLTEDGTLFARRTRQNPIHKASDISLEGRWTIIFKL